MSARRTLVALALCALAGWQPLSALAVPRSHDDRDSGVPAPVAPQGGAAPAAPHHAPAAAPEPATPGIKSLGDADQVVHFVDHGDGWSMHAENIPTDTILRLWHQAGGPNVIEKIVVDRPNTLSVHHLAPERILERLLEDYSYTLHYGAGGKLDEVRIYSPSPASTFKTPRLVETLKSWKETEVPPPAAPPAEAQPEPGAPEPGAAEPGAMAPGAAEPEPAAAGSGDAESKPASDAEPQ